MVLQAIKRASLGSVREKKWLRNGLECLVVRRLTRKHCRHNPGDRTEWRVTDAGRYTVSNSSSDKILSTV
jgi:hypothetical protein